MEPNPFLKYITKEILEALENRMKRKKRKHFWKEFNRRHFGLRWFGMLPLSFKMAWQKRKKIRS